MIIILDLGSGLTCGNRMQDVRAMIRSVFDHDNRKHEVILKWQLFRRFGDLTPLHPGVFAEAYHFARALGYATTASVFDRESLRFLKQFSVPFVKIACLEDRLYLAEEWGGHGYWDVPVVASFATEHHRNLIVNKGWHPLACVRTYPATIADYEHRHDPDWLSQGLSDHTDHHDEMRLLRHYRPAIYETHYCLDSQQGPDTGPFALRPSQLERMLEAL